MNSEPERQKVNTIIAWDEFWKRKERIIKWAPFRLERRGGMKRSRVFLRR